VQESKHNEKIQLTFHLQLVVVVKMYSLMKIITGESCLLLILEASFVANYWSTFCTVNPQQAGSTKQMDTIPLTPITK
jgi:hypothetical protein